MDLSLLLSLKHSETWNECGPKYIFSEISISTFHNITHKEVLPRIHKSNFTLFYNYDFIN